MKYPFLSIKGGYYQSTHLDGMPRGWQKAFGNDMLRMLKKAIRLGKLKHYSVSQVKEKWGELRWYDNDGSEYTDAIISRYTYQSQHTCALCGKPATWNSSGWILPLCETCALEHTNGKKPEDCGYTPIINGLGDE